MGKIHHLFGRKITREEYVFALIAALVYILMLTKVCNTLMIDSKALIDLLFISTPIKVEAALTYIPSSSLSSYYIQLTLDSIFIFSFYPLLISLFLDSKTLQITILLSGFADMVENGIMASFLVDSSPIPHLMWAASSVTNIKFIFLFISLFIIVVKLVKNLSER